MSGTRESGALRIFFYNWPIYVVAWLLAPLGAGLALHFGVPGSNGFIAAAAIGLVWSASSLAISFYIYDASELSGGRWVRALAPTRVESWLSVHAGLDAEVELDDVLPGKFLGAIDIYDEQEMPARSIRRARARTPRKHEATPSSPTALVSASASCDCIVVAFSAHELRDQSLRDRFFQELHRTLRPAGRVLLIEHVRDLANFAAYGPGAFHFLARSEWLRVAQASGFRVALERRVTPFVMALALEKSA